MAIWKDLEAFFNEKFNHTDHARIHDIWHICFEGFDVDVGWQKQMEKDLMKDNHWSYKDPDAVDDNAHRHKGAGSERKSHIAMIASREKAQTMRRVVSGSEISIAGMEERAAAARDYKVRKSNLIGYVPLDNTKKGINCI